MACFLVVHQSCIYLSLRPVKEQIISCYTLKASEPSRGELSFCQDFISVRDKSI